MKYPIIEHTRLVWINLGTDLCNHFNIITVPFLLQLAHFQTIYLLSQQCYTLIKKAAIFTLFTHFCSVFFLSTKMNEI